MSSLKAALEIFKQARSYARTGRVPEEVSLQRAAALTQFRESDLLREAAWVILCSGFREAVVRKQFGFISLAFCDWESARTIIRLSDQCIGAARSVFNHRRKLMAIVGVANMIVLCGFDNLKQRITDDPILTLQKLPYIGPITVWHLAKNLGAKVSKPDRHLTRLALALGFGDAHAMCEAIAIACGEQVDVVDLVLWRYVVDCKKALPESLLRRRPRHQLGSSLSRVKIAG